MIKIYFFILYFYFLFLKNVGTSISSPKVQFEPIHKLLIFDEPMQVLFNGIENDTMYVVEKKGVVQVANMDRETKNKSVFLYYLYQSAVKNGLLVNNIILLN